MITKSKFLPLNVFISGLSLNGFIREWFVTFYIVSVAIFLFTATCLAQTPITCGIPITDSISTANEKDNYTFTANGGDRVLIRVLRTSGSLDPCLKLLDSTGKQIAVNCPLFCDGNYAAIETTLSPGGTYTITVSDCGENETGDYKLLWLRLNNPCNSTPITCDQSVSSSISAELERDFYTFTASAGDRVLIRALRTTDSLDPCLVLYDSTGKQIAVNCPLFCDGNYAAIETTLSPGGTYTITVSDCGENETGDYKLIWQRLNNPCNATAIICGASSSLSATGEQDFYTFTAGAGDKATIRAIRTSGAMQPCLELYDSTGTRISSACGSSSSPFTSIDTPLTAGGIYTIITSDRDNNEIGNYVLKLQKNTFACPEIAVPALAGGKKIVAEAGSTVLITWTAPEGISSFEIWFSTDGCATFSTLIATVPGDTRAFEWTVPAELATGNGCIRIIGKDATGNIVYDKNSDAFLVLESVIETTRTYEYDKINRLTKIASEDGGEITYTYDAVGNRLTLIANTPVIPTTTTTTTTTRVSTTSTTSTTTTTSSTTTTTLPSKICRTCPPAFSVRQGRKACKTFKVWNCGNGILTWTVSEDCNWLTLSPLNGTSTREKDTVRACVNTTGMAKGEYQCTVTIAGEGASNAPQTCVIKLKVK